MGSMFSSQGMSQQQLMELSFNITFASKQMSKLSKSHEKEHEVQKKKAKISLQKGDVESAKIYAQNAIRKKKEGLNALRLSSRLDSTASSVKNAATMQTVTKQMKNVTLGMDKALKSMNVEELTATMDNFERQFENLDVMGEYMDTAIASTTALTTPEDQVTSLLSQIADEHNLDVQAQLNTGGKYSNLDLNFDEKLPDLPLHSVS